ncbi:hypothetical protein BN137_1022 [Cronobacter condimenti 1330]|uniref:Uncharacterized protein n=1 Tax=Cronobacter condimenti 1330 TaxID=1073999 RepID=K8ABQ7_9ENTR|nr:hypothetical protein BN137_1022 [Cronobacter condimenti 1330]
MVIFKSIFLEDSRLLIEPVKGSSIVTRMPLFIMRPSL